MKRNTLIRLALVFALILSISAFMCSCGGGEESSEPEEPEKTADLTLQQYFEENPDELQQIKDEVAEDEDMQETLKHIDFDVYAKDNTLYYDYTFKETFSQDKVDALTDSLEETLESMEDSMVSRIEPIEQGFGVNGIVIHMMYRNGDGTVLAERDYTK